MILVRRPRASGDPIGRGPIFDVSGRPRIAGMTPQTFLPVPNIMPASQHQNPKSDIEIRLLKPRPIMELAKYSALQLMPLQGQSMNYIKSLQRKPNGKLILAADHADAGRRGQEQPPRSG